MEDCIHGTNPECCATCRQLEGVGSSGGSGQPWGGETKQDVLNEICDQLGIRRRDVGVGSSLPSDDFDEISHRLALGGGSMPEIGEAAAAKAGLIWSADCDSRGTVSGGGSTVTFEGLRVIRSALAQLL